MTIRDTPWPEGTPCWVDLAVDDFRAAQSFYSELFGWSVPTGTEEFGGYSTVTKNGKNVVGLMPKMDASMPTAWTTYLACDDLDATMAKVRAGGGQVVADVMDVADMGRMALAVDPGGAFVGFWQSGAHTGFQLANEPGSVGWNENFSTDWEANKAFYRSVLGWDYDDMSGEGFQYAAFLVGDRPGGGIAPVGEGMTPHWNVYFLVADADDTVGMVKRLGGTVLQQPWDTEYGRCAAVADDQGASFMVMGAMDQESAAEV